MPAYPYGMADESSPADTMRERADESRYRLRALMHTNRWLLAGGMAAAVIAPALGDAYVADADAAWRGDARIAVSEADRPAEAAVCPTLTWSRDGDAGGLPGPFGNWRRVGAAQLELALVADGGFEAAVSAVGGAPWDTVAGVHMVRMAGGRVTTLSGNRWRHDATGLAASNGDPRIHEALLAAADAGTDRP